MASVKTDLGYVAVERNGCIDIYCDDMYVCELHNKTFADYAYNGKVDKDELDDAILEEINLTDSVEKLREML